LDNLRDLSSGNVQGSERGRRGATLGIVIGTIFWLAVSILVVVVALVGGVATAARRRWRVFAAVVVVLLVAATSSTFAVVSLARRGVRAGQAAVESGADLAFDTYGRARDELAVDDEGCPVGLPFDGPERRLEVITCGDGIADDAEVLESRTDYLLDGSYSTVLAAGPDDVAALLAAPAPWGAEWIDGPAEVPSDEFFSPANDDVATAPTVVHAVVHSNGGDSGNLLAVDPATNRVWFAYWDF